MSIRILVKDYPHRHVALATDTHALILRHTPSSENTGSGSRNGSQTSLSGNGVATARCMAEFADTDEVDFEGYIPISAQPTHGTLGLITVNNDVFLCVVSGASKVATVRPGETVQRIHSVDFHCLTTSEYDHLLNDEINPYPTDTLDEDGYETGLNHGRREHAVEHPCLTIKKLLSSGTFYYSSDFDLTRRMQDRAPDGSTVAIDSLDAGFLWNSYMIQPLVNFRSRLSEREKVALDSSGILTSAIRGFVQTMTVPASSSPARAAKSGLPSSLTLISRLSCRRAGTRFNARGIDDDGNVANFVETETVFWTPEGTCFSYVQIRGSVPVFWEQASGLLPGQQKITITRSPEATQPAFDKHFEYLELSYGAVHVVNLLSNEKSGELNLINLYRHHIQNSSLNHSRGKGELSDRELLRATDYDFHAETRGPGGYEMANMIGHSLSHSADGFAYYLAEETEENSYEPTHGSQMIRKPVTILQQEGVFRTNCLDCLDRTNLVQTIISKMALEAFLNHRSERASQDFWMRHGTLWADNGDHLSRIYAGTGALKSSFTRSGKMSLAGALADARKSATRMYINNFADKGRQVTIDMLLGRLVGQQPVYLYDPINDYITAEMTRRSAEYTSLSDIYMWVGTFNLNGKTNGLNDDLSSWLCPPVDSSQSFPEIVAVGFQEIVELSPQQIMSTDPARRQTWERAVKETLNDHARRHGVEEYVLLRGGQLVGASLSIFVRSSVLKFIKNVEGSVKKTGMSGMAGNKGAVAIRMDYANTSLCFVTAHLAAGFANYEERNRDYKTISHGLRFQRNRAIENHDSVIWLGDFNYRIGLPNERVRKLVQMGDLESLYENDQLNLQMMAGLTFPYYSEARITFEPTYRYDIGTDNYDTSEKARIPAWCDRVLRKGDNLRQINYNIAPLKFSDHRPVYATFRCTISMVDEKKKEQLSHRLYQQRRGQVGDPTNSKGDDSEDEDLIGYESIEPGLPPASSDKRKWWLDNGLPVRARVQPPASNSIPNPNRPSNPFTPSPEADWIEVNKTGSLPTRGNVMNQPLVALEAPKLNLATRKVPPPYNPSQTSLISPVTADGTLSDYGPSTLARPSSSTSIASMPASSVTRKAAPPVPKKPTVLSKSPTGLSDTSTLSSAKSREAPSLPPPRRSQTTAGAIISPTSSTRGIIQPYRASPSYSPGPGVLRKAPPGTTSKPDEPIPPLPPRTNTLNGSGLLDDTDDKGMDELKGWEVLRPR